MNEHVSAHGAGDRSERWDDLVADLEGQVDSFATAEERSEVADLARAELSAVSLADRLRAAIGHDVLVMVRGAGPIRGRVVAAGTDWLFLDDGLRETLVVRSAVLTVTGVGTAASDTDAMTTVERRWGVAAVLRRHARDRAVVRLVLDTGDVVTGTVDTVGSDHLELAEHPADEPRRPEAVRARRLVPFGVLATVARDR